MNEREVAEVLKEHFINRGYKVLLELQITEDDCTITFPGYVKQRRPDLLLIDPFSNIVAIEVENEPFVEHPEVFTEISNITYLAFPASSLKKEHIVRFFTAELRRSIDSGIGLLSVSRKAVKTLVGPATRTLPENIKDELMRLSEQRIQKEIRIELIEFYKFMYEKSSKHWDKACSLLEEGLHSEFYKEGKQALVFALKARYTQMLRELPSIYISITDLYDSLIRYSQTLKSRPRWLPIKRHIDRISDGKSEESIEIYSITKSLEDSLKRLGVSLDIAPVVVMS
jgi:HEPN domain-containing protein